MFGCAERSEERIIKNSNYFDEIYYFLASILMINMENDSMKKEDIFKKVKSFKLNLIMIGEEIKSCSGALWNSDNNRITISLFPYKVDKFLKEYNFELNKEMTLFVGLNCGFGAGYSKLTLDWINDLNSLLKLKHICAFTFTNDYEDLKGEKLILEYLKAKFIVINSDNSFKSMSTYKNEGNDLNEWSCGNYGYYIVHGNEKFIKVDNQKVIDILKENKLYKK